MTRPGPLDQPNTADPNNPNNPAPAAPPASGNRQDFAQTVPMQHTVGRPTIIGETPEEEEFSAPSEPREKVSRQFGAPTLHREIPGQRVVPAEYQGAVFTGITGIVGQSLVHTGVDMTDEEMTEEQRRVAQAAQLSPQHVSQTDVPIKADPSEEVQVYPGTTHADMPEQLQAQRDEEGAPIKQDSDETETVTEEEDEED